MRMIRLKIDGKIVLAPEGTTILNAALKAGIHILTCAICKWMI